MKERKRENEREREREGVTPLMFYSSKSLGSPSKNYDAEDGPGHFFCSLCVRTRKTHQINI